MAGAGAGAAAAGAAEGVDGGGPVAPLQGSPILSAPDDHVPHSGTPQKPEAGHGVSCSSKSLFLQS